MREKLLVDVVSRESNGGCDWLMLKRRRNDSKTTQKGFRICEELIKKEKKNLSLRVYSNSTTDIQRLKVTKGTRILLSSFFVCLILFLC